MRSESDDDAQQTAMTTHGDSAISSIIRPQLWVHWTITVLCLAAWAGILYLGDLTEQTQSGLKDILGLRSGRLATFFSTVMLLWAGQLALLIYWYRRKSRNDFAGRYRMWLWIGGMLQMFLAVAATRAHVPFSAYVQRLWPQDIPMYGLLCWLVPIATLSLTLYRLLRIELKRHRSGKLLLNVAAVAGVTAGASLLVGRFLPTRIYDLVQIGSATLAQLSLATALLMHARYVIHVCNEAPRRERRVRRLLNATRNAIRHLPLPSLARVKVPGVSLPRVSLPKLPDPKISLPRLRLPKPTFPAIRLPKPSTADDVKQAAGKDSSQTESSTPSRQSLMSRLLKPKPQADVPEVTESKTPVQTRAVLTSRKKKRPQSSTSETRRVDGAEAQKGPRKAPTRSLDAILDEFGGDGEVDAETLSGLSKKERRRLRKKQRELQLAGR